MRQPRKPSPPLHGCGPGSLQKQEPQQLADILERVLDKGIVIVGDIQVRLLDIELLTIKLRLVVTSLERAKELGLDWWVGDAYFSRRGAARALPPRSTQRPRPAQHRSRRPLAEPH